MIAFLTDFILFSDKRRKVFSDFLKKYSTPELFAIYGNPGGAAAAKLAGKLLSSKTILATGVGCVGAAGCDHFMVHSGLYDNLSYSLSKLSGMSEEDAIKRLPNPDNRSSAIDAIIARKNTK